MELKSNDNMHELPPLTIRGVKRALINPPESPETRSCIALDWLQMAVILPLKNCDSREKKKAAIEFYEPAGSFLFAVEKTEKRSINYKRIYYINTCITGEWEKCGELQIEPYVSFLDADIGQLKIENKFLYHADIKGFVQSVLRELDMQFKHISRLDVCADFQRTKYSPDVQRLLSDIVKEKLVFKGRKTQRASAFEDKEVSSRSGKYYTGITWGSYASGLKLVLYNKSLEMRKKKDKPWIRANWAANGLKAGADIWRLEFAVKKDLKEMVCLESGEILGHTTLSILEPENMQLYYRTLYAKHFQVARNEPGKQFCRMKKVSVLDLSHPSTLLQRISEKSSSNNMEKHHIKKLANIVRSYADGNTMISDHVRKVIIDLVNSYDIDEWFKREFPDINITDVTLPVKRDIYDYRGSVFIQQDLNYN